MPDDAFNRLKRSPRERMRPVVAMAVASFRADPTRMSGALALRGVAALSPPVFALALSSLVNRAAARGVELADLASAVVVLAVAVAARIILDEVGWKLVSIVEEKTAHLIDQQILGIMTGLAGLEHLERPEYLDRVDRIREEQWLLAMSVEALIGVFAVGVQIVATIGVLATVHPGLLALPVLAMPSLWAGAKAERIRLETVEVHGSEWRRAEDLLDLATEVEPAKELRVFGLGPELLARHRALWDGIEGWERSHRLVGAYLISGARAVFVIGYVAAIAVVGRAVVAGSAPVTDLVLTVVLSGQVMAQLQGATGNANWAAWTLTAVRRWLWLLDHSAAGGGVKPGSAAPPDRLNDGIRFEDVTFTYPGADEPVLAGVNLHLRAGTSLAIVGENGAGKSTLVKLLCRFYDPTSGHVTVDGVDLTSLDPERWRTRIGAAFQDHAKLELRAVQTVALGLGDKDRADDEAAATVALGRAASEDVISALPNGLSTQLGARWPDGVDLSGGQWQKLALGRGMARTEPVPLLLLLDEPTAALDAETEHRLFERYATQATEAAAAAGSVTVLVSHRFSTVRMADQIVVIDGGRIVESGSHAELVAAGGLYAELFGLQQRAYR